MATISEGRITNKDKLEFRDNTHLREYYEGVWANGGYGDGFVMNGVSVGNLYHEGRRASALRLLNPAPGEMILDAGCGDAVFTKRLADTGALAYGVDIAKNAFSSAVSSSNSNPSYSQMNLEHLGFSDGSFDKVVSIETLEHLLHPESALDEFNRVLRDEGEVVITYPFLNTRKSQRKRIAKDPKNFLSISEHLTEWDYDETIEKFDSAGFDVNASEGIVFDFGPLNRLQRISRTATLAMVKAKLAIRYFPRQSAFASFRFKKR